MVENDKVEIEDEEEDDSSEYSPKSEFSKPAIVAEAVRKIREARACEMKEGYYNFKIGKDGSTTKIWVPDSRKIFVSNVNATLSILSPEISRSERMLEVIKVIDEKKKELFEKYCYYERTRCQLKNGSWGWAVTNKRWMPRVDENLPTENSAYPKSKRWEIKKGVWNDMINNYWDEMVELYDMINSEINLLADENNYFKSGARM
jgi:hypothetical protein